MYIMPAMYLPFLMYAAWMGMVLRPFMQRIDEAFETAALAADDSLDMRTSDQTVAPDFYRPSYHVQ